MSALRRKCDDEATAVNNPKRILRERCQDAASSSTAPVVENPPNAP